MPEEIILDPAKNNADVAKKLIDQSTINPNPNDLDVRESQSALDDLAASKTKEKADQPGIDPGDKVAADKKAADDKAAAEKVAADTKAAADKKAADDEIVKRHESIFKDTPQLPSNVSAKATEAFSAVKIKAAQEISARETELEKLRKENEDLKSKTANIKPLTPEQEKELEDLRNFRNRLDVEADPKFKEFNKVVESNREFVYAQLRKSPEVTDTIIDEIKKHGGPEMVDLTKLFTKVNDPALQRIVESKIADIEQAKWNREEAVKAAKANIGQYVAEREKAYTQASTAHQDATRKELDDLRKVEGMSWFRQQTVDPKADEATKKSIEGYNAFVLDLNAKVDEASKDDSPQMRALLLAGMAQLLYVQKLYEGSKSRLETIETDHKKATEAKDTEIKELNAKIEKFKTAGGSRLRDGGGAPPGGRLPEAKNNGIDLTRPGDAIDAIARQIHEEKVAKGK